MSIGLVGSHRTGKTSLAEAVSNETDLPLILTSTSSVCAEMKIDPSMPMSFGKRMSLQNAILDRLEEQWSKDRVFVTDRTPLDCLMYTTADLAMDVAESPEEFLLYENYAKRCFDMTNSLFSTVILVQPGIPIVVDFEKATAALNKTYMEHLNTIAMGLIRDERIDCSAFYISRDATKMSSRVDAITNVWREIIGLSNNLKKDAVSH